jgi:hypothetical protein
MPPLRSAVISLTLCRDDLMIADDIIVLKHGAVSALFGRQFDESTGCFFMEHML